MSAPGCAPGRVASGRVDAGPAKAWRRCSLSGAVMAKLDLGCGNSKAPGYLGADRLLLPGVDVVCDLGRFPYPFASDSVEAVRVSHLLEHLDDPLGALEEIWRICKHGARVYVRVPHYSGRYAWKDPTHKRCFAAASFSYFGGNPYSYYSPARFQVIELRLKYFVEPPPRKLYQWFGWCVQKFLDRHPTFGERFLAYWVGGIDEISATLEAIKR